MAGEVPTLSERVIFIFALQQRQECSADFKDIHSAFAQLKQEHPEMLPELIFTTGDVYPYSARLEELLGTMLHCGVLEEHVYSGPSTVAKYRVPPAVREEAKERLKSLTPKYQVLLPKMATRFEELCSCPAE